MSCLVSVHKTSVCEHFKCTLNGGAKAWSTLVGGDEQQYRPHQ